MPLGPFNFVNRGGIPLIESNAVTVGDTSVIITIANNLFRFLEDRGVFLFRLNQSIPEGSDSLPVVFSWTSNFNQQLRTQPLTLVGGAAATEEQLEGVGVYLIYYDKTANLLQLMTTGVGTEQAANNASNG